MVGTFGTLARVLLLVPALFAGEGQGAITHFIPHIATGWENFLAVDNVGPASATFNLTLFDGTGTCIYSQDQTIEAQRFASFLPRSLAADAESGLIRTDSADLQFRIAYVEPSQKGTAEFVLPTTTATVLNFNLGVYPATSVPLTWKGLALMNHGAEVAQTTLYALDGAGAVLGTHGLGLQPNQRVRGTIESYFAGLSFTQVARVVAASDQPLTGLNISGNGFAQLLFSLARPGTTVPDTGSDGQKPETLPDFASLNLYRADSPLNQPIPGDAAVDPDSENRIVSLLNAGDLVIQVGQYSAPVFIADANTPRVDVHLACGAPWEIGVGTLEDVPIPVWAEPADDRDGADNPPVDCGEDSDQDNHMVVLDPVGRCEYGLWQARKHEDGTWTASYAAAIGMDSEGIYPTGMSTRGSGFSFLGGLIWPDELRDGRIGHALVFSYPFARSGGPVSPATDSDGTSDLSSAIPEGARLQLDPELDLDSLDLTAYERTIARALQEYGMFLVDQGGSSGIGLYAIDPKSVRTNPYSGLLPDEDFVALDGIPLDRFRLLALPEQDADWREGLALPVNDCVSYR
ncbi:hypothetical protein SCOR_03845 [Sulfidibacter corallicola]|uniref:Uncharacterized protein n=1 Tax=Sulfidibacter corallicola TaxID=2818388 RepID=A0A8A4THQ1_SULCO|nr:hypothetical protein [Sulfidibacter corallicola]QTD48341.1 hypothetical protein J3U87_22405 [Sulfidibacter corallicola]